MPHLAPGELQCLYQLGRCAEYLKAGELLTCCEDLLQDRSLLDDFEARVAGVASWQTKHFTSVFNFRFNRILIYCLTRVLRPGLFVETGVLHGMTSAFILDALDHNEHGRLLSIDLPSPFDQGPANRDGYHATLPPGLETGWIVPERLRGRWDLRLGPSSRELPAALATAPPIDVFFHDSEHTYGTMWSELVFAWPRLREGGILLCDNIEANSSFFDFCRKVDRQPLLVPTPDEQRHDAVRLGIVVR